MRAIQEQYHNRICLIPDTKEDKEILISGRITIDVRYEQVDADGSMYVLKLDTIKKASGRRRKRKNKK